MEQMGRVNRMHRKYRSGRRQSKLSNESASCASHCVTLLYYVVESQRIVRKTNIGNAKPPI